MLCVHRFKYKRIHAMDIARKDIEPIRNEESLFRLTDVIVNSNHNCFPVVSHTNELPHTAAQAFITR